MSAPERASCGERQHGRGIAGHHGTSRDSKGQRPAPVDFAAVNLAALPALEALCVRWLPGGRRVGAEWVCGSLSGGGGHSCKVRLNGARRGRWADFATGQRGGDVVSLAAAVTGMSQVEAARRLAEMLGVQVQ